MMRRAQKIVPNLWFDRQAEEAAKLYASIFKDSGLGRFVRAGKAGFEVHGIPEGTVMTVEFVAAGHRFVAINGGPLFKFTPAISFLVSCRTKEEVDALWAPLAEGGAALMELGEYPFSPWYGWIQDRYGVSWQVMAMGTLPFRQGVMPTLMFANEQCGKAEEAIRLYAAIFRDGKVGDIARYTGAEGPDTAGTVMHGQFQLDGQWFAAMDSAYPHAFGFNEAVSLMVECETQEEIDHYWGRLTSGGGEESMCGWLKDRYGVSWQVAPKILGDMLQDPDRRKVDRVTEAFLKMRKFDIKELERAFKG
jgi:predicted 3-demethylubiquinone-9 3-methyltransferase (glyoxalase superfamily)